MIKKFLLLSCALSVVCFVPAMAEEAAKPEATKSEVIPLSKEEKRQAKEVQSIIKQQKSDFDNEKDFVARVIA